MVISQTYQQVKGMDKEEVFYPQRLQKLDFRLCIRMWRNRGEVHSTTTDRDSNQTTHKNKMRSQSVRPIMGRILRKTET